MMDMPEDIRELDRKLRSLRFSPRASLGPEVVGRLRRGEQPTGGRPHRFRRHLGTAAVALLTAGSALALATLGPLAGADRVTVDRCCYDLDGGGEADDGVLILAEPDARVHRLRVYEDLDGSGSYTSGDLVRLDRGRQPAVHGLAGKATVTIDRCCLDFDGGGPDDDGLLVIGVPPDRVLVAAIYETAVKGPPRGSHPAGWPLR
ncbi:MAG TPA: hypothetical protein VFU40_02605 [Gemmatimonadales bacterium]|nr:hypothetical protein [Gemmatimonadales bacterium]